MKSKEGTRSALILDGHLTAAVGAHLEASLKHESRRERAFWRWMFPIGMRGVKWALEGGHEGRFHPGDGLHKLWAFLAHHMPQKQS